MTPAPRDFQADRELMALIAAAREVVRESQFKDNYAVVRAAARALARALAPFEGGDE